MPRSFAGNHFDSLFNQLVEDICFDPEYETAPRGMKVRENIATVFELYNPRNRLLMSKARKADYGFAVGEFLWYWQGKNDLETMLYYNKRMGQFSDDGRTLNSAYGFRMKEQHDFEIGGYPGDGSSISQWEAAVKTLVQDNDSRRAIIIINEPMDEVVATGRGSKDVPCTLSLQFFIRGGKLHLHANMRSNDVFWGLTYDLFSFTLLQECMLLELRKAGLKDLGLGRYTHCAGSLHIYERHFEAAQSVRDEYLSKDFIVAAPMEPIDLEGLSLLAEQEEGLRTGKVAQIDEAQFGGGVRWMAAQLNGHRRKRDAERG
jgi:thymidylate synthase